MRRNLPAMSFETDSPLDELWQEYAQAFKDFDDLTLARWLAQTLGQLNGKVWRYSHPLLGSYRLAAQHAHDRQIWLKRLATAPHEYAESPCCRAPLLPMLTRDVHENGLICIHCNGTAVALEDIPADARTPILRWAEKYAKVHAVAHWEDRQRKKVANYDDAFEQAAQDAEKLLSYAGRDLATKLIEFYPAVVWEDQDECLEVRPEDISF